MSAWPHWTQMRTAVRVHWEQLDESGQTLKSDERYYVTSLEPTVLSPVQWIEVARGHWAVESAPQAHRKEGSQNELTNCVARVGAGVRPRDLLLG